MCPHATAPHDYTALPGVIVSFSPSESSKTVPLLIVDDSEVEEVEMFLVSIHTEEKATVIESNTASIYISNNDGKGHIVFKCITSC